LHATARDGAERRLLRRLRLDRLVQRPEDRARSRLSHRRDPDRVPRETGQGRRLRTLATDVSDRERPDALAGREPAVEVAADADPLPERLVTGGDLDAGNLGQVRWQEASLKRCRDVAQLVVAP